MRLFRHDVRRTREQPDFLFWLNWTSQLHARDVNAWPVRRRAWVDTDEAKRQTTIGALDSYLCRKRLAVF